MHLATCGGVKIRFAPSASSASAEPDLDDTLRFPCLATCPPAAATTNRHDVEILKVHAPSPPVPTMSRKRLLSATSTRLENSRMTRAAVTISSSVSPLARRVAKMAADAGAVNSPLISAVMKACVVSLDKSCLLISWLSVFATLNILICALC